MAPEAVSPADAKAAVRVVPAVAVKADRAVAVDVKAAVRLLAHLPTAVPVADAKAAPLPAAERPTARLPAAAVGSSRPWVAALRAGYNQNAGRAVDGFTGISFGGGLDLAFLRVDYAWIALGALGSANRITLAFRF